MASIVTVSQVNKYLAFKLKNDLKLKSITVRGEISDFNVNFRSGHAYFTLKDESSALRGIMFSRTVRSLRFAPKQGDRVLCTGNIEVYEPGGSYQIIASELVPEGIGEQYKRLSELKERLREQGVFSEERKKPLPRLPKRIAVVTSVSGAAIQDICNILKRRYPVGELMIFPAVVQGAAAPESICGSLALADKSGADVLILARGGGSEEDLAPFNTESVTRAVASCRTPIITAVGHETDTTLSDHASDKRAPTPSAAAEICAEPIETLYGALEMMKSRLDGAYEAVLSENAVRLDSLNRRLRTLAPDNELREAERRLDLAKRRLSALVTRDLETRAAELSRLHSSLEAMDPYRVLERGYSITLKNGAAVTDPRQIAENDEVTIKFSDFTASAVITAVIQ